MRRVGLCYGLMGMALPLYLSGNVVVITGDHPEDKQAIEYSPAAVPDLVQLDPVPPPIDINTSRSSGRVMNQRQRRKLLRQVPQRYKP